MADQKFVILGQEIALGESAQLKIEIAKLHTRNSIAIPAIVERSPKAGPVLLLMAGVHGDEINGVAILRDVIRKNYHKPDCGTIICIPVFNVFGYLHLSREFPDGRDLNRVFPGSKNGSMANQFAYIIYDLYGEFKKKILAPIDCFVFSVNTAPIVHRGDALFHISTRVQSVREATA